MNKRSQSQNVIYTSHRTKTESLNPMRRSDKQGRERKLPIRKSQFRQDGNSFFTHEGIKKQQMENNPRGAALKSESTAVDKQDSESGGKSSVASNQGAFVTERGRSSSDSQINIIQMKHGGTHLCERQAGCVDLVSSVCRASVEKVHKSRLVPPRPASLLAAGKRSSVPQKKLNLDVAGNDSPPSDTDVALKCSSAVDRTFKNQEKDGNARRDVSRSQGDGVPEDPGLDKDKNNENDFGLLTLVNSLKENGFVDKMNGEGGYEDVKALTDTESVIMKDKTPLSLLHDPTISNNFTSTRTKDKPLKNMDDVRSSGVPEGPSFETKVEPSNFDACPPAGELIVWETSATHEKLENWRICEEEPEGESGALQEKTRDSSAECLESHHQREMPKSSTLSPFVPTQMLKDWSGLEKMIHHIVKISFENLSGFAVFAAEISRSFPDLPESLNRLILDFEETLKNVAERISDTVNRESAGQMMSINVSVEDELPQEGRQTSEDAESMQQGASAHSEAIKDGLLSASVQIHPQTNDVRKNATDNAPELTLSFCKLKVEVSESRPEAKKKEEGKQSQSDPVMVSCSDDFAFVESHFSEPAQTKVVVRGSDVGLVDSRNPVGQLVAKTGEQREIHRSQSCLLVPIDDVELQLKRHRMLSNSRVGQSSKVRRLIEKTADEIKAMALPELVLMSLEEGRVVGCQQIKSIGVVSNGEELSPEDMDSCEEVDEEAATQLHQPATEVMAEDVKADPVLNSVKHLRGRTGLSLDKNKTDCQIS